MSRSRVNEPSTVKRRRATMTSQQPTIDLTAAPRAGRADRARSAAAEAASEPAEEATLQRQRGCGRRCGGSLHGNRLVVVRPCDRVHDLLLGEFLGAVDHRDESDQYAVAHDLRL